MIAGNLIPGRVDWMDFRTVTDLAKSLEVFSCS